MPTSAATLVQRTRRFLGDWPEDDATTASLATNAASISVADTSLYAPGWLIQVDTEAYQVKALTSPTALSVRPAVRGTTTATHASGATILVRPHFLDIEYLDGINGAIEAAFPWIYQPVVDESLTAVATTYEYTIPNVNSMPIPYISSVEFKESGDLTFRPFKSWDVRRGSTPVLKLRRSLPTGTIRINGFGPLPRLTDLTSSLDAQFPVVAEDALTFYAAQFLLASGEARRVREDTGARDDRENANRTGSSLAASNALLTRFQMRLRDCGLPPMPKHVISVI